VVEQLPSKHKSLNSNEIGRGRGRERFYVLDINQINQIMAGQDFLLLCRPPLYIHVDIYFSQHHLLKRPSFF
jgi:hypothetical protein